MLTEAVLSCRRDKRGKNTTQWQIILKGETPFFISFDILVEIYELHFR